jgi:glycosyltransferase involved in cell wall biosynthesis
MGFRTLIALAYGKLAGIRVWIWWGGTVHSEKNISMGRRLLRPMIVRIAKRWISYGSTTTEYLESIGVARRQILQIQNCVEQEVFLDEPKNATTWFEDMPHPVILTVGQLIPRKGLDKLIEACGRIASRGLEFSLVLVGEGSDRERLEELARQCSIKNFKIVPHQHPSQLNEIYRSSDVFVFPTLEDIWGLAVNEAILTGTPVLCSKYAGCAPELLPASNIFDATYPASFDAALDQVFNHSIRPPDRSKLRRWQEVGEMIHRSLVDGSPCDHAMVSGRKSYEISSFSRGDIDIGRACKSQMD